MEPAIRGDGKIVQARQGEITKKSIARDVIDKRGFNQPVLMGWIREEEMGNEAGIKPYQ